ncbi:hypothetical protein HDU91_006170, partial [Kappamyces sp. JEL0680]
MDRKEHPESTRPASPTNDHPSFTAQEANSQESLEDWANSFAQSAIQQHRMSAVAPEPVAGTAKDNAKDAVQQKRTSIAQIPEPVAETAVTFKRGSVYMDSKTGQVYNGAPTPAEKELPIVPEDSTQVDAPTELYEQAPVLVEGYGQVPQLYPPTNVPYEQQYPSSYDQQPGPYGPSMYQQPGLYSHPPYEHSYAYPQTGNALAPENQAQFYFQPSEIESHQPEFIDSGAQNFAPEPLERFPTQKSVQFALPPPSSTVTASDLQNDPANRESGYSYQWVERERGEDDRTLAPVALVEEKQAMEDPKTDRKKRRRYCFCFTKASHCCLLFLFILIVLGVFAYLIFPGLPTWQVSDPYLTKGSNSLQLKGTSPLSFEFDVSEDISVYSTSYFAWAAREVDVLFELKDPSGTVIPQFKGTGVINDLRFAGRSTTNFTI